MWCGFNVVGGEEEARRGQAVGRGNEYKKMIFMLSVPCPSMCPVLFSPAHPAPSQERIGLSAIC